jgi:hypothetical protein
MPLPEQACPTLAANHQQVAALNLRATRLNMPSFGAMPFDFNAEGVRVYGKARNATSEIGARCLAAAMVATSAGAVAFLHQGDALSGQFTDFQIIDGYGVLAAETPPMKEAA